MKIKFTILCVFAITVLFSAVCQKPSGQADGTSEQISAQKTEVPVEAMVIRLQRVEQPLPFTGILEPFHSVDLVAEVSGKVEKVFKDVGARISTEDTLAVIDDRIPLSQYRQARSQVMSSENNLLIAQLNLESDQMLYESSDISWLAFQNSQLALKNAEATLLAARAQLVAMEKQYRDTRIMSPISGRIARKYIDLGTMVSPGMPLYRVVNIQRFKIMLTVPQEVVGNIQPGTRAVVHISALNGQSITGRVSRISPQADERTGGFQAEIQVHNTADMVMKAGMTARVDLILTSLGDRLVVPEYAMVNKNGREHVYKVSGRMAKLTEIEIDEIIGSQIVVAGGLDQGDTVVVVGMKNLGLETPVFIESLIQ